jgi:hypothetical protein
LVTFCFAIALPLSYTIRISWSVANQSSNVAGAISSKCAMSCCVSPSPALSFIILLSFSVNLSFLMINYRGENFAAYNKPKRTPGHSDKSHAVLAKVGDEVKLIRFGQQGVTGSPAKKGESESDRARRKAFYARHAKNIAKGKMSAAYWSAKVKW